MKRLVFACLVAISLPASVLAFGSDEQWTSGWGQGIAEAIITKGPGNNIYVTCGQGAGYDATGIRFMLAGKEPPGNSITLTFDGEDPTDYWISGGKITSDCRACAANYEEVISRLKRHQSVHVRFENGDATRFTLKGASEAIIECIPDFTR